MGRTKLNETEAWQGECLLVKEIGEDWWHCRHCLLTKKTKNLKNSCFLRSAKRHFWAVHRDIFDKITSFEKENFSQLRLANYMTIVTETEQFKREKIVRFAQTVLPINVFRAENTTLWKSWNLWKYPNCLTTKQYRTIGRSYNRSALQK